MDVSAALQDEVQAQLASRRRQIGALVAPALIGLWWWVAPANMAPGAATLTALLILTLVLWLSEALPVAITALLAPSLGVLFGLSDAATLFAPFGHPVVWLLLALNLLTATAEWRGLDRVLAVQFFSERRTTLGQLATQVALAAFALATWMPKRRVVALMATVVKGQEERFGRRFQRLGLSSIAFAAVLGGVILPTGAPANLIAIAALAQVHGLELPLLHWAVVGLPVAFVLLALWLMALRQLLGPEAAQVVHGDVQPREPPATDPNLRQRVRRRPPTTQALRVPEQALVLGQLGRNQLVIAAALLLLGLFLALPGLGRWLLDPTTATRLHAALPPAPLALLICAALFAIPASQTPGSAVRRQTIATWDISQRVEWEVLLLVGCALSLGQQSLDTGLSQWLGEATIRILGPNSGLGLTVAMTALALAMTQIASGAITAAICAQLAIVAAQQIAVSPVAPTLAVGMAASFGLLLPMSDEANQLSFRTGAFRRGQLVTRGLFGVGAALLVIPPFAVVIARLLAK